MFKRAIFAALLALGTLTSVAAPAAASVVTIKNGDFTGAIATTGDFKDVVYHPTPFGLGYGSNLRNFAWFASGCACNNAIASYPNLIPDLYAPGKPAGYEGNIYLLDAAAEFADGVFLQQVIDNLSVGSRYTVSFLQASGSKYLTGDTAQWHVAFGGSVYEPDAGHPYPRLIGASTPQDAAEMINLPDVGFTDWTRQSLTFTARDSSQLLSFFATGNGQPPFALLADVSISAVPEPATWAMMILGFGVVGGAMRAAKRRSDEKFDARIKRIASGEAA